MKISTLSGGFVDGAEQVIPHFFCLLLPVIFFSAFLCCCLHKLPSPPLSSPSLYPTFSAVCRFLFHCLTVSWDDTATSDLPLDLRGIVLHVCVCWWCESMPILWNMCGCLCMCDTLRVCLLSHQSQCRCVSWTSSRSLHPLLEPPHLGKVGDGFWWILVFLLPFFQWPGYQLMLLGTVRSESILEWLEGLESHRIISCHPDLTDLLVCSTELNCTGLYCACVRHLLQAVGSLTLKCMSWSKS